MAQHRSLSEILADFDTGAVTVDAQGRIGSSDPAVSARLAELKALLDEGIPTTAEETPNPNGVQCYCGGGGGGSQSGCP